MKAFQLTFLLVSFAAHSQSIMIKDVTIVDVRSGKLGTNNDVFIEGNKIKTIGKSLKIIPGSTVINGKGKYLIPGLWDMHAHMLGRRDWTAPLYVAAGVTGIRDMANSISLEEAKGYLQNVLNGKMTGPRFINGVRLLDGPQSRFPQVAILIPNKEYAMKVADSLKDAGADFYKVYETLPREAFYAIIEKGKQYHMAVAGHVPASITTDEAANAGMKSIEHLKFFGGDENMPKEIRDSIRNSFRGAMWDLANKDTLSATQKNKAGVQIASTYYRPGAAEKKGELFVKNNTWITPTMVQSLRGYYTKEDLLQNTSWDYMPATVAGSWRYRVANDIKIMRWDYTEYVQLELQTIAGFHKAGVKFLAGTDANTAFIGNVPGFSVHEEMKLFVKAGLTNLEALQTATLNAAIFMEATDSLGTVETNKIADLVLLDANPLDNISNTQKIYGVVLNGRWLDRKKLDAILEEVKTLVKTK